VKVPPATEAKARLRFEQYFDWTRQQKCPLWVKSGHWFTTAKGGG